MKHGVLWTVESGSARPEPELPLDEQITNCENAILNGSPYDMMGYLKELLVKSDKERRDARLRANPRRAGQHPAP